MDTGAVPESREELRRWLGGRWALYFSHPGDFARYDFECDRWYVMLEDGFDAADVCVLGPLHSGAVPGSTWIEAVGGKLSRLHAGDGTGRFVAAYDESLRLQRTFTYTTSHSLPSPLDLATAAAALRERTMLGKVRRARRMRIAAMMSLATAALAVLLGAASRRSAKVSG